MHRNGSRKQTRAVQIAALAAAALVAGIGLSRHHAEAGQQSYETFELATTIGDGFTIASVGDLIMAFPASKLSDPARQAAFDLVRGADVGFANMESTILDAATWDGDFAGPFVGTPDVAEDVKNLGFDLVARSNNHSGEYGIEGLLDTNERLARAGVVSAGSAESYWAARAPRFVSTDKGRVGLVATASSFSAGVVANPGRGEWTGRGGASALRTTRWWVVPPSMWNAVTTIREAFPTGGSLYAPLGETDDEITILGRRFRKADVDGPHWSYDIDERDLNDVLAMVREGKVKSDFLAVAIHSHETHGADGVWPEIDPLPGDFLPRFAKATIDNGADAFFGSGVHVLRGIEIYKDRPIFYGLGEFFRQMDIVGPAAWGGRGQGGTFRGDRNSNALKYESIVAVSEFAGGRLSQVRLYPTDLGHGERMAHRGVPRLASPEVARRVLDRLRKLSEPFGTTIDIEDGVGIIRLQ
jgi:poly-gamma-glutamate synthesis protein (capsule biosynthesis protein)